MDWYDFLNVKSSKMLSFDLVAEAYGLTYPRPSSENFSFVGRRVFQTSHSAVCINQNAVENLRT